MHWIALQAESAWRSSQAGPTVLTPWTASDTDVLMRALAWRALVYTPRVARLDEAVVLEVSASARLFGGLPALRAQLLAEPPAPLVCAEASSALLALAGLRLGLPGPLFAPQDADAMPLATLSAAGAHLEVLARMGINRWGELRALPRAGLARRFGADLLQALDAAYGERPEAHTWLELPEVFDELLELPALLDSAPALMFAAERLLLQLKAWLTARQSGVLALQWQWLFDQRRSVAATGELLIRTAEPTRDMAHLARLTAEQLERIALAAPVHSLRLASLQVVPLPTASTSLLIAQRRAGDSLHQMIERLGARLGADQIVCLAPQDDHRPEQMQRLVPAQSAGPLRQASATRADKPPRRTARTPMPPGRGAEAQIYPPWLLRQPLRLAVKGSRPLYHGPLKLLAGPQRLEAGWWVAATQAGEEASVSLRDYFIASSEQAGLLWIYRERVGAAALEAASFAPAAAAAGPGGPDVSRWFLHGLYA